MNFVPTFKKEKMKIEKNILKNPTNRSFYGPWVKELHTHLSKDINKKNLKEKL
jgi:hypothetical protein